MDNVSEQDKPPDCAHRIDVLLVIQGAELGAPISAEAMVALVEGLIEVIVECDAERSAGQRRLAAGEPPCTGDRPAPF